MSHNLYTTEIHRKIYHDKEGVCLQVGPDSDGLNMVRICAPTKEDKNYFGPIDVQLDPRLVLQLVKAMTAAAQEALSQEARDKSTT